MALDFAFNTDIPVAQTIQSALSLASLPSGPMPRAVWEFTSTLRQAVIAEAIALTGSTALANSVADSPLLGSDFNFGLVTDQARELVTKAQAVVRMAVNPKSFRTDQPKRFTALDTQEGTTFHHFTNSRGQNNHYLTLRFEGNTGNLDLRAGDSALARLRAWHNLYLLSQEPMLLGPGLENKFTVTFNSKLFPRPVTFEGFYERVLDIDLNAERPNSADYSFSFIVTNTRPRLDALLGEMMSFVQQGTSTPTPATSSTLFSGSQGGNPGV